MKLKTSQPSAARRPTSPPPAPLYRYETTFPEDLGTLIERKVATHDEDSPQSLIRRAVRRYLIPEESNAR